MAQVRLSMRAIREVLRLKYERGLSDREIAASCGIKRSTTNDYINRARNAGLIWPPPADLSDFELESRLFPSNKAPAAFKPLPDFAYIDSELREYKRLNITKDLLWQEYRQCHADGYSYSQFCHHYRTWLKKRDYCMRQEHRYGEKLFVDYGDGLYLTDARTGGKKLTQLFTAAWGASNYIYAEASLTQAKESWIGAHVRAFDYFGCAPLALVPDCLKSAVDKACRYEPDINSGYLNMAQHYGCAVVPARPVHPRDKAKVEVSVLIAKRWILAVLRKRTFYTLEEMNEAICELLEKIKDRKLRKMGQSRRELFETFERPKALKLPERPYELSEWRAARLNIDYHVAVDDHYYSAPFRLIHEKLDIRLTANTVEIFFRGARVALHCRSHVKFGHTTVKEHMPEAHRKYLEWTPSRIISWAEKTGPATGLLVKAILERAVFPEQGYRSCLGILRLSRRYPTDRMEAASRRATQYHAHSFRAVRNILEKGLDRLEIPAVHKPLDPHENIRGSEYYTKGENGHA